LSAHFVVGPFDLSALLLSALFPVGPFFVGPFDGTQKFYDVQTFFTLELKQHKNKQKKIHCEKLQNREKMSVGKTFFV
jgi:beta-xylosidase